MGPGQNCAITSLRGDRESWYLLVQSINRPKTAVAASSPYSTSLSKIYHGGLFKVLPKSNYTPIISLIYQASNFIKRKMCAYMCVSMQTSTIVCYTLDNSLALFPYMSAGTFITAPLSLTLLVVHGVMLSSTSLPLPPFWQESFKYLLKKLGRLLQNTYCTSKPLSCASAKSPNPTSAKCPCPWK